MLHIQLTGDSIMARFEGNTAEPMINTCLKNKLVADVTIRNTAISGNNTFDILARLDKDILSVTTSDAIFLLIGGNDLALHKQVSLPQFEQNLGAIIEDLLTKYPANNVFLITPPPVDEAKQKYRNNALIATYVTTMAKVADFYGCPFLNLYQTFLEIGHLPTLMHGLRNDGVHFGLAGYKHLADLIIGGLESAGMIDSQPS